MVTAVSKEGIKRKILYHNVFLMVDDYDTLNFNLNEPKNFLNLNLNITFEFSSEGKVLSVTSKYGNDKHLILTLHNWNSPDMSENKKPLVFTLTNEKKVWVKFKTGGDINNHLRTFHLTAWVEI
jgi:hypothetical protein